MDLSNQNLPMPLASIFLYTKNQFKEYAVQKDACSEMICQQICQDLEIKPLACTLFALRINDTPHFLPGCRPLLPNAKYDFRIRFQVKDLQTLKNLDKNAYNYFYHQVKWDLTNSKIPDLVYPNHKEKVLGLIITSMYIEMLEFDTTVEELKKNYKNYVPHKYMKKHSFVIKNKIAEQLEQIKHKHDAYYAKTAYLQSVTTNAPNYFMEKCAAITSYLPEDELERGTCPIDLEFAPHHPDRPGLSAYYSYKKLWKHVSKVEDLLAIVVDNDTVTFAMRSTNVGFVVTITDKARLESFVTCVAGYFRLMVTWTIDLCKSFKSPLLQELRHLKCHGPIGGEFSYRKLQDKQSIPGSYIIRQCEKSFGVYYIDLVIKSVSMETFKITIQQDNGNTMWELHQEGAKKLFGTLQDLAKSIKTESTHKLRLAPSDYDKPPLLLLCLPESQLVIIKAASDTTEMEMRQKMPQIIDPATELRKYIHTEKIIENGSIKEMRAEWLLPNTTKLEVTLKILNSKDHLTEFLNLAYKWGQLQSTELVKMYGFTLSAPYTMVIESTRLGTLDEFLLSGKNVPIVGLIDAAFSLARALYFLQEHNTIHGKIRCSSLHVVKFDGTSLTVRLGDPGFRCTYTKADFPWIPVEYYANLERVTTDFKSEIFAYATTLWEIFSGGKKPPLQNALASRRRLPQPANCPFDIYEIMLSGWDIPERRFSSPQHIFSALISTREKNQKSYATIEPVGVEPDREQFSISSGSSLPSNTTDQTLLKSDGSISNISTDNEHSSIISNSSLADENSWMLDESDYNLEENVHLLSGDNALDAENFELGMKVIELDNGMRLIYQDNSYLGKGQYGTVYKGTLEYGEHSVIPVAIKTLNSPSTSDRKDFQREISVMKRLDHPNIVKIKTTTDIPHIAIIMEFVKHGSFLKYLSCSSPSLTVPCLLKFAKDIASGMEYLTKKKIVHRDLAARNVLVDDGQTVKISDFGLSQFVNEKGYYRTQNRRFIPYKWYAPETISNEKYSFQSDVWSYGVTLFEMFSKGKEPSFEAHIQGDLDDFLRRLRNNQRLPQPELCPNDIYNSLLMECWEYDTEKRPTFTEILVKLDDFIAEYGEVV